MLLEIDTCGKSTLAANHGHLQRLTEMRVKLNGTTERRKSADKQPATKNSRLSAQTGVDSDRSPDGRIRRCLNSRAASEFFTGTLMFRYGNDVA